MRVIDDAGTDSLSIILSDHPVADPGVCLHEPWGSPPTRKTS